MADPSSLAHRIELEQRADEVVESYEKDVVNRTTVQLLRMLSELEPHLRGYYQSAINDLANETDPSVRERRAAALIDEITFLIKQLDIAEEQMEVMDNWKKATASITDHAITAAQRSLESYGDFSFRDVRIDPEQIAYSNSEIPKRLAHHGKKFVETVQDNIAGGLITGKGWGYQAKELRAAAATQLWRAKTIVRTESMRAYDHARQKSYGAAGVGFVQRLGTNDKRICVYCLRRHGMVYPLGTESVLHPNDRCVMLPFRPEWVLDGIIKPLEWETTRQELAAKADVSLKRFDTHCPLPQYRP